MSKYPIFEELNKMFDTVEYPETWSRDTMAASSELKPSARHYYDIGNARDRDLSTAWSKGDDEGGGTYLWFMFDVVDFGNDYLYIFPGWGGLSETWAKNNRIKDASITVVGYNRWTITGGPNVTFLKTVERFSITFLDRFAYQGFPIGRYLLEHNNMGKGIKLFAVILEIQGVYAGSKWDDTPIAEITVKSGSQEPPYVRER